MYLIIAEANILVQGEIKVNLLLFSLLKLIG